MNVLQVSSIDGRGGGANVAFRLHVAYLGMGLDSHLLVKAAYSRAPAIHSTVGGEGVLRFVEHAVGRLDRSLGWQGLLNPSTLGLPLRSLFRRTDIAHLHVLHGGYFNLLALPWLTRLRPTVWTLHDMWSLTGHCGHPLECRRWLSGCGKCPHLELPPAVARDATALVWKVKREVFRNSRLLGVSPSLWLKALVESSPLGAFMECRHIPNAAPTGVFLPRSRARIRRVLDLPVDRPLVAVFTAGPASIYKGPEIPERLVDALSRCASVKPDILALGTPETAKRLKGLPVHAVGWVDDERLLAQYLAAADVYVMTSIAENAPLAAIEALACGTPVAAFAVGGVPEIVRDGQTGLLAPVGDVDALTRAVLAILESPDLAARLSRKAREVAEKEYSLDLQARSYLALYEEAIEMFRPGSGKPQRDAGAAPFPRSLQP